MIPSSISTQSKIKRRKKQRKRRTIPVIIIRYVFLALCLWILTFVLGSIAFNKNFTWTLPEPIQLLETKLHNQLRIQMRDLLEKPNQPLRQENLHIVQQAQLVDISYVDVRGNGKHHPHRGAKDENGNWGYIHDEKALRRNPPSIYESNHFHGDQQLLLEEICEIQDSNYWMIQEKVYVDIEAHEEAEKLQQTTKNQQSRAKIFCFIYTTEKGHSKIIPIRETWG